MCDKVNNDLLKSNLNQLHLESTDYIKGLIENNPEILRQIYVDCSDKVKNYIQKQGGSVDDAKDIFQDALMVIYRNALKEDFELTSQFDTYLIGICRFIFLNKNKKNRNNHVTNDALERYTYDSNLEKAILEHEKHEIYESNFQKLGQLCRDILELYFAKINMEMIAEKLNLKNAHTARNRKYRCQKELEQLIRADMKYQELKKQ